MNREEQEKQNFMKTLSTPAINAGETEEINMASIIKDFGRNYNTLTIINTNTTCAIEVILDGTTVQHVTANQGQFTLSAEDEMKFTFPAFKNLHGSTNMSADDIKLTVGRTG